VLVSAPILSLLTLLVFGLAPAVQSTRVDLIVTLKDEAVSTSGSRCRTRLRNTLVLAQVSLSAVLLFAAALLLRSIRKARPYPSGRERLEFARRLVHRSTI